MKNKYGTLLTKCSTTKSRNAYLAIVAFLLSPMSASAGLVAYDYAGTGFDPAWSITGTFVLDEADVIPGSNLVEKIVSWEFSWTNGTETHETSSEISSLVPDGSPDHNFYFIVDSDGAVLRVALENYAGSDRHPLFGFEHDGITWNASTDLGCCVQGNGSFSGPRTLLEFVDIEIKPGSDDNCGGVIPVAILGSDTFNVSQIDSATLAFGSLKIREKGNGAVFCGIEDINEDGYLDLVCQFDNGLTEGLVSGELLDGTSIEGSDLFCVAH